jgi:hypothetical protein
MRSEIDGLAERAILRARVVQDFALRFDYGMGSLPTDCAGLKIQVIPEAVGLLPLLWRPAGSQMPWLRLGVRGLAARGK